MNPSLLFYFEDKLLKMRGLYTLFTLCYGATLIALSTDTSGGDNRDFLAVTSGLSTLYCMVANYNTIYGNGKPSSMMLIVGPVHQYLFWLLLAYYKGHVYGSDPAGVLNTVHTSMMGAFSLDMFVKTWFLTCVPEKYLDYVKGGTSESSAV